MNTIKDRIENFIWNIKHKIDVFVNPRHDSLRKSITKEWKDLDGRIEDFLSAVVISFVEEENGLEQITMIESSLKDTDEKLKKDWGSVTNFWDYYETHYPVYKKLEEIYLWVSSKRKHMQNYIDSIYSKSNFLDYCDEIDKAEKRIHEKDTEYFTYLIKYRSYLWT